MILLSILVLSFFSKSLSTTLLAFLGQVKAKISARLFGILAAIRLVLSM